MDISFSGYFWNKLNFYASWKFNDILFTFFIILGSILNVEFRNGFNLILTISISIFKVVKHLLVALDLKPTTRYKKNMVRSSNIYPFQSNVVFHTETSHLICSANQLTGFYMMRTLVVKGLSSHHLLVQCVKSVQSWHTAQKRKFSIKDFFSKCDQIRRKLRIWSHLLKKS